MRISRVLVFERVVPVESTICCPHPPLPTVNEVQTEPRPGKTAPGSAELELETISPIVSSPGHRPRGSGGKIGPRAETSAQVSLYGPHSSRDGWKWAPV